MIRSFLSLQRASIGFDDAPILTLRAYLPGDAFDDNPGAGEPVRSRGRLPSAVCPASSPPRRRPAFPATMGVIAVRLLTDDRLAPGQEIGAQVIAATDGLFEALGLRVVEGRALTTSETIDPEARVTVINERFSRELWPDGSAVGRRVGFRSGDEIMWYRIVGIAPDIVYEELGEQTDQSQRNLYMPYAGERPAHDGVSDPREGRSQSAARAGARRASPGARRAAALRHAHAPRSAPLHHLRAALLRRDDGRVRRDGAAAGLPRRLRDAGLCHAPAHA